MVFDHVTLTETIRPGGIASRASGVIFGVSFSLEITRMASG
jgi:hypothetical protein